MIGSVIPRVQQVWQGSRCLSSRPCRRQGRGRVNSRPAGETRGKTLPQNKTKTVENKATKEKSLLKILVHSYKPILLFPWVTVSIMYIVVQTKRTQLSGAVLPDIIDVFFPIRDESYFCCVVKS